MTFAEILELAIVHEAESWCPGCGATTTETFIELMTYLMKADPDTFHRAIHDITEEIHHYEEGELAA